MWTQTELLGRWLRGSVCLGILSERRKPPLHYSICHPCALENGHGWCWDIRTKQCPSHEQVLLGGNLTDSDSGLHEGQRSQTNTLNHGHTVQLLLQASSYPRAGKRLPNSCRFAQVSWFRGAVSTPILDFLWVFTLSSQYLMS